MSELTKVENGKATFTLHVPAEEYVKSIEKAYRRLAGKFAEFGDLLFIFQIEKRLVVQFAC